MSQPIRRACEVCSGADFQRLFTKDEHAFFRCRSCAMIRSDPQPTEAVLDQIYGSKYYDAWGVQTDADQVWRLKKSTFLKYVLATVSLKPGARVLDCGAAFGAFMVAAKEMGMEAFGIELSAQAAAEIAHRFGPNRVFCGPFEQAAFPGLGEAAFDGVFMCDFIEHVRDPVAVLRKAVTLLRPGGSLVLTTPDSGSLSCRALAARWPHYKIEHLYCFNRCNIAMLLERVGVNVSRGGRASKVLNLDYIRHQFNTYPRPVVTTAINFLDCVAGPRLLRRPMSFSFGEMIVVGVKNERGVVPQHRRRSGREPIEIPPPLTEQQ